jgi:outer membrane protein with beta-barrel domain
MKAIAKVCLVAATIGSLAATNADAQVRGILGAGLSVPVGDFADEAVGGAKAGGGTALIGAEWLPAGRTLGLRLDGNFSQFCTTACDASGGELDIKYQVLNANLSGLLELPMRAAPRVRPYLLAGVGIYHHKLRGDDVPSTADDSRTDFGVSGGLGFNFDVGRFGLFVEGRFHNVFADGSDLQYIPVTVGLRLGGR